MNTNSYVHLKFSFVFSVVSHGQLYKLPKQAVEQENRDLFME